MIVASGLAWLNPNVAAANVERSLFRSNPIVLVLRLDAGTANLCLSR